MQDACRVVGYNWCVTINDDIEQIDDLSWRDAARAALLPLAQNVALRESLSVLWALSVDLDIPFHELMGGVPDCVRDGGTGAIHLRSRLPSGSCPPRIDTVADRFPELERSGAGVG